MSMLCTLSLLLNLFCEIRVRRELLPGAPLLWIHSIQVLAVCCLSTLTVRLATGKRLRKRREFITNEAKHYERAAICLLLPPSSTPLLRLSRVTSGRSSHSVILVLEMETTRKPPSWHLARCQLIRMAHWRIWS